MGGGGGVWELLSQDLEVTREVVRSVQMRREWCQTASPDELCYPVVSPKWARHPNNPERFYRVRYPTKESNIHPSTHKGRFLTLPLKISHTKRPLLMLSGHYWCEKILCFSLLKNKFKNLITIDVVKQRSTKILRANTSISFTRSGYHCTLHILTHFKSSQ